MLRYEVAARSLVEPYVGVAAALGAYALGLTGTGLFVSYWAGTLAALAYAALGLRRCYGGLRLRTYRLVPARIVALSRRAYRTLMLNGYARVDLRLTEAGEPYVLEANPNPELARDEDFAESALAAGIPYDELIQRLLMLGLRWEPKRFG